MISYTTNLSYFILKTQMKIMEKGRRVPLENDPSNYLSIGYILHINLKFEREELEKVLITRIIIVGYTMFENCVTK